MLDTHPSFRALSEEYVECVMRYHPVIATRAGIHDYDHLLPNDTPDGFRERAAWLGDLEHRLTSVAEAGLDAEGRVDVGLLRSRLAGLRLDLERIRIQARNPVLFADTALSGVHLLMRRAFAPLDERKESILARMMAIPEYLARARANLEAAPPAILDLASEVSVQGVSFMEEVTQQLIRAFPSEAERIEHAGSLARRGFARYQDFLHQELAPRGGGELGIGERWMNEKLEREHRLGMDCAALEAFGRNQTVSARVRLAEEAKRLDPARSWQEQLAEARRRAPGPRALLDTYRAEAARAQEFLAHKRLVPVAEGRLEIAETPHYRRPTAPVVSYQPPAPFDTDVVGALAITPPALGLDPATRAAMLAEHNEAAITLHIAREAWPGRHLQQCHAVRAPSRLRRLVQSPLFANGWGAVCEELMGQEGFFVEPRTRLVQLWHQLVAACRVRVDVGLHTGRLSLEQAAELLVVEAHLERPIADAEVRRYALAPGEAMSGAVGRERLLELREEARRRLGSGFRLPEFHAALLAGGTLPPALVREEIWSRLGA